MTQQTGWAAYMATKEQKDGPVKKFYLLKAHGQMLRAAGFNTVAMSCKEIETAILECIEGGPQS